MELQIEDHRRHKGARTVFKARHSMLVEMAMELLDLEGDGETYNINQNFTGHSERRMTIKVMDESYGLDITWVCQ